MKIKSVILAVASSLSISSFAENKNDDIQKAIQLLEQNGYQIDNPIENKKTPSAGITLKTNQIGVIDSFISGDFGRTRYKNNYINEDSFKFTDSSYNVRGSIAYQDPSHLGVQFDALYSQDNMKYAKLSTIDLAAHAFYRNDKFLLGLFGQYKQPKLRNEDYSADIYGQFFSPDQVFFGGEAQGYFGNLTITGQLARQEFINQSQSSSIDVSGNVVDVFKYGNVATLKANYFINNNWKATAGFTYNNIEMNGLLYEASATESRSRKFSLGTEYRLSNYPISFYGDYTYNKFNYEVPNADGIEGINSRMNTNALLVGIKYNFGTDSLKARDRSGASLDPINNKGFSDYIGSLLSRGLGLI